MQLTTNDNPAEMAAWLAAQAQAIWGLEPTPELERATQRLAEAMAAVSAVTVPEDADPVAPARAYGL